MVIIIVIIAVVIIFAILLFVRSMLGGQNKYLKQALRNEEMGDYNEALLTYDRLLSEGKATPEIRWRIANVAIKLGIFQRAEKELSIIESTNNLPKNVSLTAVKCLIADCYAKTGQAKKAFMELYELAQGNVTEPLVYLELGKIYGGQAKTQKAIQYIEKYLNYSKNDGEGFYFLAKAYLDVGLLPKAIENLEKALRLNCLDNGMVNYYLGILYFSEKKYNIALQNFTNVLKQKASNEVFANTHKLIGLCYKEKGLIDEAITSFEQSKMYSKKDDIKQIDKNALFNEGVLLYKKGKFANALEIFQKLLLFKFREAEVQKVIDAIKGKMKGINDDEHFEISDSVISENPANKILRNGLLYIKNRFDIDRIEQEVEKGISAKPSHSDPKKTDNTQKTTKYMSMDDINNMGTKEFKDLSRKLVESLGFEIKAEPKFQGDVDYIEGNAINFLLVPIANDKPKREILFTIRRFKTEIEELIISNFIDWLEQKDFTKGIFIGSNKFTKEALELAHRYVNIKFIDQTGLSKMLERIL